jgi:hypothetical protein
MQGVDPELVALEIAATAQRAFFRSQMVLPIPVRNYGQLTKREVAPLPIVAGTKARRAFVGCWRGSDRHHEWLLAIRQSRDRNRGAGRSRKPDQAQCGARCPHIEIVMARRGVCSPQPQAILAAAQATQVS